VQDFFQEFLPLWDGVQHIDSILGLLSYIPMQPFPDAYATFLQPAERALLRADPSSQTYIHLIDLYTSLFRRWAVQAPLGSKPPRPGQVLTHADQRAFSDLAAHVTQISTSLLISLPAPDNPLTSTILTFYELLSACSLPDRVPIILPPTHLLQLLAVTSSTTELSRVAGLIAAFKLALGRHPKPLADYYPEAPIEDFNRLVKDFARLLWTARALVVSHDKDGTASGVGMSCDPALHAMLHTYLDSLDPSYAIQISYSVSYHPALASLGAAGWRDLEDAEIKRNGYDGGSIKRLDGPVSKRALEKLEIEGGVGVDWERCRVELVKWLEGRACGGLREFVWAVVRGVGERYEEDV
jgi:centromere protein I